MKNVLSGSIDNMNKIYAEKSLKSFIQQMELYYLGKTFFEPNRIIQSIENNMDPEFRERPKYVDDNIIFSIKENGKYDIYVELSCVAPPLLKQGYHSETSVSGLIPYVIVDLNIEIRKVDQ